MNPATTPSLPLGYTTFNNLVYDVQTDAVVSGPNKVAFNVPTVTDSAVFANLRILHLERDSLDPDRLRWIDRTILAPNAPAPDFAAKTLYAKVEELGKFALVSGNQPLPPNPPTNNLAITGGASPDPVRADNNLTYTVTITNNGPDAATQVVTKSLLSPNVNFLSATTSQGSSKEAEGFIICNLGTLNAGASATITLNVKTTANGLQLPPQGKPIESTTMARGDETDTDYANNIVTTSATLLPDTNATPTVSISSPTNNTVLTTPANITITASASDSDGSISAVEFFDNGNSIGTGTSAGANQYSITLNNLTVGYHSLLAIATDNAGKGAASSLVNVTVNPPFMVNITSPANEAIFTASTPIFIISKPVDINGTISGVNFYADGSLLGAGTAFYGGQYSLIWNNAPAGRHSLTAVATNNLGATVTSPPLAITVNTPPTASITSPANGTSYMTPANINLTASAGDSDGFIGRVDFYANNSFIGTGTLLGSSTVTGPNLYNLIWNNVPTGVYSVKAVARDSSGATVASSPITINVNVPPTVTAISPVSGPVAGGTSVTITGTGFQAGATVTLGGTAATNITVVSSRQPVRRVEQWLHL
ncbi:MAG: DUF11 domain-containing protein [Acidobacteria bacterium]|nr:DUF11 domain-containing protein [Acidobacteriota bacterium]